MKDVTFGQYYPVQSFLHKMDPRLKLLFLIAYITAVFLAKNFYGIAACAFVLVAAVAFSRVPVTKVLRSIRGILFLVAFTAIINTLFYQGETVYCSWWIIKISKEGLIFSAFLICRLFLLVLCSSDRKSVV